MKLCPFRDLKYRKQRERDFENGQHNDKHEFAGDFHWYLYGCGFKGFNFLLSMIYRHSPLNFSQVIQNVLVISLFIKNNQRWEYFQPYTSNGTRLRYVDEVGVWEARASYKINSNIRVKVEAINLFSAPKSQDYYVQGNLGEVNDYGPRLFAGVSVKY